MKIYQIHVKYGHDVVGGNTNIVSKKVFAIKSDAEKYMPTFIEKIYTEDKDGLLGCVDISGKIVELQLDAKWQNNGYKLANVDG